MSSVSWWRRLAERPFAWAVARRNRRFDAGIGVERVAVPVISVGNLTVGGTGKTPTVAWLAGRWIARGRRVAIVSRGYGGRAGRGPLIVSDGSGPRVSARECGDEPRQLAASLIGAIVVVGSDRVAGAQAAIELGADMILLDDGFQHRRLARDVDIVLIDATAPFGGRALLPAGRLREPLSALARANLILLTRCDKAPRAGDTAPSAVSLHEPSLDALERELEVIAPDVPRAHSRHAVTGFWREGHGLAAPKRVIAFCAIAHPESFRRDLLQAGVELVGFHTARDHRPWSDQQLRRLEAEADAADATLVTTAKDVARIGDALPSGAAVTVLRIELDVDDSTVVDAAIAPVLERTRDLPATTSASVDDARSGA